MCLRALCAASSISVAHYHGAQKEPLLAAVARGDYDVLLTTPETYRSSVLQARYLRALAGVRLWTCCNLSKKIHVVW